MSLYEAIVKTDSSFAFSGSIIRTWSGTQILKRIVDKPAFCLIDTNELLHKKELIDKHGGWQNKDNNDWLMVKKWLDGGERYAATGLATSNYTLRPDWKGTAMFLYSQTKHRMMKK